MYLSLGRILLSIYIMQGYRNAKMNWKKFVVEYKLESKEVYEMPSFHKGYMET